MNRGLLVLGLATAGAMASAVTVWDNFSSWDGNVTSGWPGQAQVFVAPTDNILMEWRSEFDAQMGGLPVNFRIMDAPGGTPGGSTYFNMTPTVPGGGGVVGFTGMNVSLISGQSYAAVWDFLGYSGASIHFTGIDVVPGNGQWGTTGGGFSDFPSLDQKLTATFVPEPASMIALGVGLAALLRRRRR